MLLGVGLYAADNNVAPALPAPDPRFKADLLLIVAHEDDDTLIAGYLAKLTLDEHKRVAVIYCTSGTGGGNAVGNESGLSLGQVRVIEAKRALESIGIENVWYLNGRDTPSQNVLWSLETWNHGSILDQTVRLVRLTRPEVIVTWLPDYVVGENHGDHQAAGVIATEAFDMAADPLKFPEQVTPPRNRNGVNNLTEGLQPWQPKKLYYQTDAFENANPYWHDASEPPRYRKNILDGTGPVYSMKDISPSRHVPYAELFAKEQSYYSSQDGAIGARALESKNFSNFEYPVHLIFGKSLVGGTVTGDVFQGITDEAIPYVPAPGYRAEQPRGVSLQIGGSWGFYRQFWEAHSLKLLPTLIPNPEVSAQYGEPIYLPMVIQNNTPENQTVSLAVDLPSGWNDNLRFDTFPVGAGERYPVQLQVTRPAKTPAGWIEIEIHAKADGREIGTIQAKAYVSRPSVLEQ